MSRPHLSSQQQRKKEPCSKLQQKSHLLAKHYQRLQQLLNLPQKLKPHFSEGSHFLGKTSPKLKASLVQLQINQRYKAKNRLLASLLVEHLFLVQKKSQISQPPSLVPQLQFSGLLHQLVAFLALVLNSNLAEACSATTHLRPPQIAYLAIPQVPVFLALQPGPYSAPQRLDSQVSSPTIATCSPKLLPQMPKMTMKMNHWKKKTRYQCTRLKVEKLSLKMV